MKHLLVDTSLNPFARELLRSAELDEPPPQSAVRLAVALGLGSSALVSTVANGAAATTNAVLGTAVAGAAKSVTTAGATASMAGTSGSASVATGTSLLSSVVASTNAVSGSVALSSAAGLSAATAATPAVGGALSALGMLKAMAIVSLTCGALSFGGTKLAMTITDAPQAASSGTSRPHQTSALQAKHASRVTAGSPSIDQLVAPPPAPKPAAQTEGDDPDEVLPALVQEARLADARNDVSRTTSPERNVGRQDIKEVAPSRLSDAADQHGALTPAELAPIAGEDPARRAAVAAFPSDDEPAAPGLNPHPGKKPKARLKTRQVEEDTELEREVLLLERARSAVAAGQPLVALQALDAYRTQARRGTMRTESLVLRVRALLALGQRSVAEREAMPFIKAAPQSPHAARLRELLGVPNDTP